MKVLVIGAGAWGSTCAKLLLENNHSVDIWAINRHLVNTINKQKRVFQSSQESKQFPKLSAGTQLEQMIEGKELLVFALPSQTLLDYFTRYSFDKHVPIVILSKGFINNEALMSHQWLKQQQGFQFVYILSGPNLANEIFSGLPASAVLGGEDAAPLTNIQTAFNSTAFRVYTNKDINGVALGGIVKNAYTIAAGVCAGLGLGINAKSALLTRMIAELQSLYQAFDADPKTMQGLSGIGDLILSSSSQNSRNYTFGFKLAQDEKDAHHFASTQTVEGIRTVSILVNYLGDLLDRYPILNVISALLNQQVTAKQAIKVLMRRDLKHEF